MIRLALLSLLLSGCASAPRKPFDPAPPRPDAAAVYFYRPSEMTARLLRPTISAGGGQLGRLANDSCGLAYLAPGMAELRSVWPGVPGSIRDDSAAVELKAGNNYYVRVRYHVGKPRKVLRGVPVAGELVYEDRTGLEQVAETEAVPQLAGMGPCAAFQPAAAPATSRSK